MTTNAHDSSATQNPTATTASTGPDAIDAGAAEVARQIAAIGDGDYVVRGITKDGLVRAFATTTRRTVQTARDAHTTSPVVTAALGRLLTCGAMMGSLLKDPQELFTFIVRGDGPIGGLTVTADAHGHVKGYAANPDVWIPLSAAGKLDVGTAVGKGSLTVIQDVPWGEPYTSQLNLVSGEIGDDMAAYFVESEQIPTSVGVGVLVDTDLSVKQAGGFIIQLMPGYTEETVERLEASLRGVKSVTAMLEEGMTPLDMLRHALGDLDFEPLEASPVSFHCNCSRERTSRVLYALGTKELQDLVDEGKPVELVCNFCNSAYTFGVDEVEKILAEARAHASGAQGADGAGGASVAGGAQGADGAGDVTIERE